YYLMAESHYFHNRRATTCGIDCQLSLCLPERQYSPTWRCKVRNPAFQAVGNSGVLPQVALRLHAVMKIKPIRAFRQNIRYSLK
ncbi:MAG: hypothetical protein LBN11_04565, partial [Tannerella sp.]|nr:hypothetical protein [Tannerella sp.]